MFFALLVWKSSSGALCSTNCLTLFNLHTRSIELNAGRVLADEDVVPDAQITVVLVRLPWVGAPEDHVKDLGGGEFEIVGEEKSLGLSLRQGH